MKLIDSVNSPNDLKKLSRKQLPQYCADVREFIIDTVRKTGGHLAPSLGVVELTVALHYVFNTPKDKIIWDVGHQVYAHKIITGRKERLHTMRQFGGLSGFTKRSESEYDEFGAGHASTSISAALGVKTALEQMGDNSKVIAVIGDGSLTGGLAYEGLNNLGELKKNLIVILNDNRMSISPNVGGIRKYLTSLITSKDYTKLKKRVEHFFNLLPGKIGKRLELTIKGLLDAFKSLLVRSQFFEAMGIHYAGPIDGHNISELIKILENIKDSDEPVLLHIHTVKGKGYTPAEKNAVKFHGIGPEGAKKQDMKTFTEVFSDIMLKLGREHKEVIAITSAMKVGTGLTVFADAFPARIYDVGIAEGHATAFAAGAAAEGVRPVVAIYSTFMQRAYDEVIHDVALQELPVIFAVDRAGIVGDDGPTHHGVFDIAFFSAVPGLTIVSPASKKEMELAFEYAISHKEPIVIRYPRDYCPDFNVPLENLESKKGYAIEGSPENVVVAVGRMFSAVKDILPKLSPAPTLINPLFIKPLSIEFYKKYFAAAKRIVVIEDHSKIGGFGQILLSFIEEYFPDKKYQYKAISFPDEFVTYGAPAKLFGAYGMDENSLIDELNKFFK